MKYFLHDSNAFNDEKITELFMLFGYEGLGLFYTFLEKIAQQEKPVKTSVLKEQLKVGKRLNKCWNFMESIGIVCSSKGESFNEQLLNFSEKYQIKKEKNRIRIANFRAKQEDVTHYESVGNTPKVKISKVKVSKGINSEEVELSSQVQEVLKLFYCFNPTINFGNKTQRSVLGKLIKQLGYERVKTAVDFVATHREDQYCPTITTPLELQSKWSKLELYATKQ